MLRARNRYVSRAYNLLTQFWPQRDGCSWRSLSHNMRHSREYRWACYCKLLWERKSEQFRVVNGSQYAFLIASFHLWLPYQLLSAAYSLFYPLYCTIYLLHQYLTGTDDGVRSGGVVLLICLGAVWIALHVAVLAVLPRLLRYVRLSDCLESYTEQLDDHSTAINTFTRIQTLYTNFCARRLAFQYLYHEHRLPDVLGHLILSYMPLREELAEPYVEPSSQWTMMLPPTSTAEAAMTRGWSDGYEIVQLLDSVTGQTTYQIVQRPLQALEAIDVQIEEDKDREDEAQERKESDRASTNSLPGKYYPA